MEYALKVLLIIAERKLSTILILFSNCLSEIE